MPKRALALGAVVFAALVLVLAQLGGPEPVAPPPQPAGAGAGEQAPETPVVDRGAGYLPYQDAQPYSSVSLWDAFARMIVALAVVLGLMGVTLIAVRRLFPNAAQSAGTGSVRVLGRVPVDTKHSVYFLQLPGRLLLIGTGGGLSTLAEITDPREMAEIVHALPGSSVPLPFGGLLQRRIRQADADVAAAAAGPEDSALDAMRRHIVGLRELARTEQPPK